MRGYRNKISQHSVLDEHSLLIEIGLGIIRLGHKSIIIVLFQRRTAQQSVAIDRNTPKLGRMLIESVGKSKIVSNHRPPD